ncbi:hypothetical protein D3C87_1499560 [compost metagenome]
MNFRVNEFLRPDSRCKKSRENVDMYLLSETKIMKLIDVKLAPAAEKIGKILMSFLCALLATANSEIFFNRGHIHKKEAINSSTNSMLFFFVLILKSDIISIFYVNEKTFK